MLKQEIELLKTFKENHPWRGDYNAKKKKFICLLNELCKLHNLESPKLLIPKKRGRFQWCKSRHGDCWLKDKKIRLRNFSIITLLHELKHWTEFNQNKNFKKLTRKEREWSAIYYSTSRFYSVWPERITHLEELRDNIKRVHHQEIKENYKENPHLSALVGIILNDIN